jgi:ubiquitin carboxyl-terminal hydrolase 36/42
VRSSDDRSFRFAVARFGHLAARTIVLSFDLRAALRHAALGFALLALVHSRVLLLAACACALVARDFGRFSYLRWRARRTLRALLCAAGLGRADSDAMPGSGFSDADAAEPEIEDVEAVGLLPPDAHVHEYDDVIRAFSSASADLDRLADLPAGLTNSGNTCFAASALQCLYHTRLLTAHFAAGPHDAESCATGASATGGFCATCEYQRHVRRSLDAAPAASFGIGRLTSSIGRIAKHFVRGRQEDSHEYISGLLDRMHVEELKAKFGADAEKFLDARTQETSFVYHVFGGYTVGRVVCGSCGHESRNYQSALDIPIEVSSGGGARVGFMSGRGTSSSSGGSSVIRSLERNFVETEELDGANKYRCASCRAYVVAEKGAKIHVSPNVLVLPLKRYQMGRASKITKHVEFPERLDLTPYMSEDAPHEGETKPEYRLYGVVVHLDFMGSAHSGHYVAFVRLRGGGGRGGGRGEEEDDDEGGGDRWVKCDDGRVTETDLETVLAQKAYLLFYERRGFRAGFPTRTDAERKRADALREADKARTARILARREDERRGKIAAAARNAAKGSSPGRSRATRSPGRRPPSTAEAPASVASDAELGSDGGSDDSERPSAPIVKPRFSLVGKQPHSDADDSASADSDDDSSRLRDPWPVRVACEMSLPTVSSASQVRVETSSREVSVAARRAHRAVIGAVSADVALPYPVDDDGCEVSFDATTRTLKVVAPAQKRDARVGAAHAAFLERRRERRDASVPASRRSSAVARLRRAGMRKDSSGASSRGKKSERASRGSRDGADGDSSDSDDGGADDLARAMGLGLRVVEPPSDYLSDDEVEPEVEITDASATRGRVEVVVKVPGVTRAAAVEAEHAPDEADERRSVLSVRVRGRYRATIELPARVAEDAVLEAKLKRREGKIAFVLPVEAPKPPGVRAR